MRSTNLPSGTLRISNAGLAWQEVIANGNGKIEVLIQGTIRVYATALTTVKDIDGNIMVTIGAGQVEYINVGTGKSGDKKSTVTVEIAGTAYVSVAREVEQGRRSR